MTGVPRMIVKYALQTAFRMPSPPFLSWLVLTMAIKNPKTIPIITAKIVMINVLPRPFNIYA